MHVPKTPIKKEKEKEKKAHNGFSNSFNGCS